jgi:predicted ATP-dependent serine protease
MNREAVMHLTRALILPGISPEDSGSNEWNTHGKFSPIDIGELLKEQAEEVQWVLEGYLAPGVFTLLAGPPKLGKTTFAYDAVVAVASGKPFLGRQVAKKNVLILSVEEHRRDIATRLRLICGEDLSGRIKIHANPLPCDEETLWVILTFIQLYDIGFVLVDTLPAWWGVEDENDASSVIKVGTPLLKIIRSSGAAWLCLAHTRKGGGEHGDEVRGSTALAAMVDIGLSMKRVPGNDNKRSLHAFSRYPDTPKLCYWSVMKAGI